MSQPSSTITSKLVPMNWQALKAVSRSSFGRLAIFLPFLPFVIDLIGSLLSSLDSTVHMEWIIQPVYDWLLANRVSAAMLYTGILIFVVAKVLFNLTVPVQIRDFDDSDVYRRNLMTDKKMAIEVDEKQYAAALSKKLNDALKTMDSLNYEHLSMRWLLTILFGCSIALLVLPTVSKFFIIFFHLVVDVALR